MNAFWRSICNPYSSEHLLENMLKMYEWRKKEYESMNHTNLVFVVCMTSSNTFSLNCGDCLRNYQTIGNFKGSSVVCKKKVLFRQTNIYST